MDGLEQVTQTSVSESQDAFQQALNSKILEEFVTRVSRCNNVPELLRAIPARAQEASKDTLNKVVDSFTRQGACITLLGVWEDALNKEEFDGITELNSLKAPSVQISKLAKEVNEPALNAITFNSAIQDVKRAALTQMIAIKKEEIRLLKTLCDERTIRDKLLQEWNNVVDDSVSPEHATILQNRQCAERLVRTAIAIGQNSLTRTFINKQKRLEKKAETEKDKTDPLSDQKSFEAMFREMMKKKQQSEKDKKINAKKGKGRAGPPKTPKNPKNHAAGVQKTSPTKGKKSGTSTKRRQRKR